MNRYGIKRHYFMSTKCCHSDGNGSYSFSWTNASHTSWKADPVTVFNSMLDNAKEGYIKKGLDVDHIEVIAFNKV